MAEVRRRLLGLIRGRSLLAQALTLAPGSTAASVASLCLRPVTFQPLAAQTYDARMPSHRMTSAVPESMKPTNEGWSEAKWKEATTWSPIICSGHTLFIGVSRGQLIQTCPGSRCFSYGANSRASFQNKGPRRGPRNTAQDEPPLYRSRTAYYDILGLTGNANQSQIKTAYYKQSFCYHPDRNAGSEEAARHFGQVSEAYTVLGSIGLRKKYDRGTLSLEDIRTAEKPGGRGASDTRKEASAQRGASASASSRTPTRPIFNFDAFYQAHYGEQLERERSMRERREALQKLKQETNKKWHNRLTEIAAIMLLLTATAFLVSFK
ncbi:hypothetical protein FKM82_021377 [Ascaphus truei]